jgi:hypothetical protein
MYSFSGFNAAFFSVAANVDRPIFNFELGCRSVEAL